MLWDGATRFTRAGKAETQAVRVRFTHGPVLNLNVPTVGAVDQAKPAVTPVEPDRSILLHRMASTEPGVMMR